MNDKQIEAEIQAKGLTAPRITPADIEAEIKSCYFFTAGQGAVASAIPEDFAALDHVTICTLILRNGTKVVGVNTGPISPENFDAELARKLARAAAIDQVWPMMGFLLRERLYQDAQGPGAMPPLADNDHVAPGCELFPEPAPAKTFLCPRRSEIPSVFKLPESDHLRGDGTCSHCGSLDGDALMERLEAGTIFLRGSDKNYKVYLETVEGGPPLLQSSRVDDDRTGDQSKWKWETREVTHGKFYFMHLSDEQMKRFVELWNEKRIKHSLYVMPYFMVKV